MKFTFEFFCRHSGFLFIEQKNTLSETKECFLNKIQILLKQYVGLKNTIETNPELEEGFKEATQFIVELAIKRFDAISFLSSQNEPEWKVLGLFIDSRDGKYYQGKPNVPVKVFEGDTSEKFSDSIFFKLRKFGIIGMKDWDSLSLLKLARSYFSIAHTNDYWIFQPLQPTIMMIKHENELKERYDALMLFMQQKLNFNQIEGVVWRFLSVPKKDSVYSFFTRIIHNRAFEMDCLNKCQLSPESDQLGVSEDELKELYSEFSQVLKFPVNLDRLRSVFIEFDLFSSPASNKFFVALFTAYLRLKTVNELRREEGLSDRAFNLHKAFFGLELLGFLLNSGLNFSEYFDKSLNDSFNNLFIYLFSDIFNKVMIEYLFNIDHMSYAILQDLVMGIMNSSQKVTGFKERFGHYFDTIIPSGGKGGGQHGGQHGGGHGHHHPSRHF